jgi:hypothetical protein
MASELLRGNNNVVHRPEHDLESIFYLLLWICTHQAGPGLPRDDLQKDFPIFKWVDPQKSFSDIADSKLTQCLSIKIFESDLLDKFHPYFEDLKPCCRDLRALFFANYDMRVVTYDAMISFLQIALDRLPDEHMSPVTPDRGPILPFAPIITHTVSLSTASEWSSWSSVEENSWGENTADIPSLDVNAAKDGQVAEEHASSDLEPPVDDEVVEGNTMDLETEGYHDSGTPLEHVSLDFINASDEPVLGSERTDVFAEVAAERFRAKTKRSRKASLRALDLWSIPTY